MRVLLVEDDPLLGDGVQVGLRQAGYVVDWVRDGEEAAAALATGDYAAVVLDIGLPKRSGLQVLRGLRARGERVPVLLLTARDAIADRVEGLDAGADDYLVKPFALEELSARLRALVRRSSGRAAPVLRHGALVLDPAARTVSRDGELVSLSARELTLLQVLLENAGRVLSREQLESALYGWDDEPMSNAVEVHIHNLRKKLGPALIRTIRGVGYTVPRAGRPDEEP